MLSPDKTGLLKSFLGALPGAIAARLAMAVEVDRLMDGTALPHDDILDAVRPILRRDRHDRTPTPLRLFCRPFQDLLDSQPRKAKQKGVIARTSVVPAWIWVAQTLLPEDAAIYVQDTKALILGHRVQEAVARAQQFWPLAGAAMAAALADPGRRKGLEKILGDAMAVEDAAEMALLLPVGQDIEQLALTLPRPVAAFTEALVWQVREIYERLLASDPDAAAYVAVAVMNRLVRPWEALRLPMLLTRKNDDTLIAKTDMGLVGEILFDRMETLKASIQVTRHPLFDADQLMEEVRSFADLSSQLVKEIELKRNGEWGKRLMAERAEIGKVMESFMDRAPREFAAALPTAKGTGADFHKHPGAEKHTMALRYARLVAGSRNFAAAASFAAKQKTVYDELCSSLQRYNDDVIKALKIDPANAVAAAQFELCAKLTALLFSEEEAELLRRRGKAALSAAA
ncbi:MAG TPA: hypothetical protein VG821_06275 [Rhizomicrobium sp.]|nr:hypothetical protein [Rhizomicrobium sp.]